MGRRLAGAVIIAVIAAFVPVSAAAGAAGPVIPRAGDYSGTTAAGEPLSFEVETRKAGPKLRPRIKRLAWVGFLRGAIPISCNTGPDRSASAGFPGPLGIGRKGRFARKGVGSSTAGRVITWVTGRFTGRRRATGTLTYRGGFNGEFCSGRTTWTATLAR